MKPEERLFDLIGNLPDDLASQTGAPKKARRKITPKQRNRWIGIAVAACLVVAVGVWGMNSYHPSVTLDDSLKNNHDIGLPGPKLNWPILNGSNNADLIVTTLPVNNRLAEYHQVENPRSIPKEQRPQHLGEAYLELENWYLPYGSTGLRYLVHQENDGSHTLWEFSSFAVLDEETKSEMADNLENSYWATVEWFSLDLNFDPYTYGEVLETIYGITGADDIRSVTVNPANMDNTDEGKKLQKKIGILRVSNRDELNTLYEAIVDMPCYGSDNWELIDLGETDPDGGLSNRVRLCRYLTIELSNGTTIDTLKYSAAGGQFYEYHGIAYEPLDDDTAAQMNDIFKIET